MKSKTTILWFMLAAALAMAIWVLNTYFQPAPTTPKALLAGLRASEVTDVQVVPAGGREINVLRTNRVWRLTTPLVYPAQTAPIEGLVGALEKLAPTLTFSAGELNAHKDVNAEFGFDHPQYTLDVAAGNQAWHLQVGNKTVTGDGVYVRLVGVTGAFITDTAWLQFLPHAAVDWRDTALVDVPDATDWLVITNGPLALELRRDPTNRLWRLVRPLAARADNFRIAKALGELRSATVARFVSDDPKADLTTYGLEPAALDVWLGSGSNLLSAIHVGKQVADLPGELYARREGWNSVLAAAKKSLTDWKGAASEFRDPNLMEVTAPVTEIQLRGQYNYTLQLDSNTWTVAGEKFPVEAELVTNLIKTVASLRVTEFVKDSVTPADLQTYGLTNPVQEVTLRAAGNPRPVIAQLLFGGTDTNGQIYVKRGDEEFVYATPAQILNDLPWTGDFFRAHQVWRFSETNVAQVTMRQNGQMLQLIRNGTQDWSVAPGSQGVVEPHRVEETVHQLGDLAVWAWLGRNRDDEAMGITTNSAMLTVELKTGEKYTVTFGGRQEMAPGESTAMAEVTLGGERWYFIFPRMLCALVAENLTIKSKTP